MFAPFSGLLFDPRHVPDPGAVTCPPYDVIDDRARAAYLERSPYNVVRLLLAEHGDARYQAASRLLERWRREGILRSDPGPRFYLYSMDYPDPDGSGIRRAQGVIGALDLEPDRQAILPHEETMERARADRLAALRATGTNLDPIVVLSPAPGLEDLLRPPGGPRIAFSGEGVEHRLYDLVDPDLHQAITAAVSTHPLAIADGHHRFATALRHRRDRRAARGSGPWDAIMAFLAPISGGLSVGPVHRVFRTADYRPDRLEPFEVRELSAPEPPREPGSLVVVPGPGHGRPPLLLRPRPAALDPLPIPWRTASPAVAREVLYPLVGVREGEAVYHPDTTAALDELGGLPRGLAVLNSPVPADTIAAALEEGLRFPQKSTFFHPKPRAGLVLRPLEALRPSGR